jgi:hypothetical protein
MSVETDEDEEKAGEAYLRARGWAPFVAGATGPDVLWIQYGGLKDPLKKPQALVRQLKYDVTAFVFMLEAIDETRPGTRRLLGSLLGGLVLDVVREFWNDEKERTELFMGAMAKVQEGLPKLFADREFRQAVEALRLLWHVQGKAVEQEKTKGEPN